ncbi:hypothetical protein AUC70_03230 [Methyloceanibacter stevinii]|uniref:Glycosyltransferase RgtA/B/C/D-like domain-containing protein n=2 Tax=Methyloceanibacter stevinii TaxID=1774970 RepID=A0A1E3VQS9_9HYPH|nr:hypothetical protein AUC70_03230 [Methyloceanibacter stevinii]
MGGALPVTLPVINLRAWRITSHTIGVLALIALTQLMTVTDARLHASFDQKHYVALGYNLARFDTFSMVRDLAIRPRPAIPTVTNQPPPLYGAREPLYPFLLSLVFKASVFDLDKINVRDLVWKGERVYPDVIAKLKLIQSILFALTAVATLIAIRCISGSWILAYLLAFLFAGCDTLWVRFLRVETLAAFLSIVLALALWAGMVARTHTRRLLFWIGAGVALGLLALTKGLYEYLPLLFVVGCLALLAWTLLWRRRLEVKYLDALVIALVAYAFILPWAARNHVEFGKFTISTRGGSILEHRATYSTITFPEYLASIEFYSRFSGIGATPVDHPFAKRDDMRRLINKYSDGRKVEYPTFRNLGTIEAEMDVLRQAGYSRTTAAAIIYLKSLPVQVAMVLPLSIRASNIAVREWKSRNALLEFWARFSRDIFHILRWAFVPVFLAGAALAAWRCDWPVFVAFLPSLYHYGMYVAFTHYIPRYNAMLVPIFLVALSYVVVILWRWACGYRAKAEAPLGPSLTRSAAARRHTNGVSPTPQDEADRGQDDVTAKGSDAVA